MQSSLEIRTGGWALMNDRLRDAMHRHGLTPDDLAERLDVDPKTVERWITKGRTPYPRHRHTIAAALQESETYLWPDAVGSERTSEVAASEIVKVYPHRSSIPADLWDRLLTNAEREVAILVYVGMFLTEMPNLLKTLEAKAESGTRIRLMFGAPNSRAVARRSEEEGIGKGAIPAKIRNVLAFFHPLADTPGVEIKCHSTTLYNSIYTYDDEMVVNPHVYGSSAPLAPALHLRRLSAGDLFDTYTKSLEQVWLTAKPVVW